MLGHAEYLFPMFALFLILTLQSDKDLVKNKTPAPDEWIK